MKTLKKNLNYYAIDDVKNVKFAVDFDKTELKEKYGLSKDEIKRLYVRLTDENVIKMQLLSNSVEGMPYDDGDDEHYSDYEIDYDENDIDRSIDYDYNYEMDCEYDGDEHLYEDSNEDYYM